MSPSRISEPQNGNSQQKFKDDLGLGIVGIGVEYPPHNLKPEDLDILIERFYKPSPALKKVQTINQFTGIESRSSIGDHDHPIANGKCAPTIDELCKIFLKEGVALSVTACRKAIKDWGGNIEDITHVVSTTCTNSANPGFDHFVAKKLGLSPTVEKVLLHGVGCSGGLAATRTAANLALGSSFRDRPARVLILACEISSVLVRSELDSIAESGKVAIGVTLFSDCASAMVLSNGIGESAESDPIYDLLGWDHTILQDTEEDLGFDVDPKGWKVVLSPRVPELACGAVPNMFENLMRSVPSISGIDKSTIPIPADFDWALHPGGLTIITGIQETMNLTPEHLRSSFEIYMNHGNSSSATVISVLDNMRRSEGKDKVVSCAFGPGLSIEMMILRRGMGENEKEMLSEALD